jgi:predicted amidohydrolase YtcJ
MNQVKQALKTWLTDQARFHDVLDGVPIVLNGETDEVALPLIAIIDQGVAIVEQNGVKLYGVMEVSLTVELHTVPEEAAQDGTTYETSEEMAQAIFEILGNRKSIDYMNASNEINVFDNLTSSGIVSVRDERRIATFDVTIIASLSNQQPIPR